MTKEQAIELGKTSARMAVDQRSEFKTLSDSVSVHRDNVRDTLNDEGGAEHEPAAWAAFDLELESIRMNSGFCAIP